MFVLVRIQVPSTIRDEDTGAVRHVDPDHVWDHVMRNHTHWHSKDVKLIYMTRRHLLEDTSLIIDARDPDSLAEFLLRHICTLKYVRGISVLLLSKMRFFSVPPERPVDFTRFTITIDAIPEFMDKIYDSISAFKPGRDITITYIAYSFQSFNASIVVSVLARSRNHLDAFISNYLKPLKGLVDTEITAISKTTRLVSPEEWQESVGPFFVAPGGKRIKNIDTYDDSLMTGC